MLFVLLQETLTNMIRLGVKPTVETLNAILSTISRMPIYRMAREKALQIVADFKSIGVMPSLGTYFYLLKTFCKESRIVIVSISLSEPNFLSFRGSY